MTTVRHTHDADDVNETALVLFRDTQSTSKNIFVGECRGNVSNDKSSSGSFKYCAMQCYYNPRPKRHQRGDMVHVSAFGIAISSGFVLPSKPY